MKKEKLNVNREACKRMIHKNFEKTGGEDMGLPPFMLTSAIFHVCGEPCVTYESNQGLCDSDDYRLTNDQIYRSHMIFMERIGY